MEVQPYIVVLGGGESGVGAALLAKKINAKVFLSDFGKIKERFKKELLEHKIDFEESGHSLNKLENADLVIKSPGIPETANIIKRLRSLSKKVISEIEFAFLHSDAKIIAVTGSNGKTTTTSLIYAMLKQFLSKVVLGGNIGKSYARSIAEGIDHEWAVLELSSFQLDDIDTFRPDIALVLNITADHLDRYEYNEELYGKAKMKIVKNQQKQDSFIYNGEDLLTAQLLKNTEVRATKKALISEDYKNGISSTDGSRNFEYNLTGQHNAFNVLAAVTAARLAGVSENEITTALAGFEAIEHRLERVSSIDGVQYINDSKATNVDAVYYALDGLESPLIWIVGGVDKGNDYSQLDELVMTKVKAIICLGVDNSKLLDYYTSFGVVIEEATEMKEAIDLAKEMSRSGDTVVLSPACASFDLFKNYEDRGRQFKLEVKQLE